MQSSEIRPTAFATDRPPNGPEAPSSRALRGGREIRQGRSIDSASVPDLAPAVDWQTAMNRAIRSQAELRRRLGFATSTGEANRSKSQAEDRFSTFVPLELLSRIRPGCPDDPILRQVLASEQELTDAPGFVSDPVGDLQSDGGGGALQKYAGRVLIVTHGACAIHCRYCFRREFPYAASGSRKQLWEPALQRVASDPSIEEVLLSGGDPLTLTDDVLDQLIERIESIAHVRRLRIHTRLPIAIPQRITHGLVDRLTNSPLSCWVVIHANHPQEIDEAVADSLERLRRGGVSLLNQSVLLRGVNDDVETLYELSTKLVDLGVVPYYLHQLDRVRGASHFWVDIERGKEIVSGLRNRLPGYAVPKYVIEKVGEQSKTPIA